MTWLQNCVYVCVLVEIRVWMQWSQWEPLSHSWCEKQMGAVLFRCVSTVEACSWIEVAVEVPPHGAKGTQWGKEGRQSRRKDWVAGLKKGQQGVERLLRHGKRGAKTKWRGGWSRGRDGDGVMGEEEGAKCVSLRSWPAIDLILVWKQRFEQLLCLTMPYSEQCTRRRTQNPSTSSNSPKCKDYCL